MSDSENHNLSNEKLSSSTQNLESRLSCFSTSIGTFERNSVNTSVDSNSSMKRKFENDSECTEDRSKKNNTDTSFCVSPWEYRRLKADLMESQAQRIKLEDRIDQLHKKNKEAVIFFDKEKNEMKSQLESNRHTIKDLEYRLNKVRKREGECREELNEKVKFYEQTKQKLSEKIFKLEAENIELTCKINMLESSSVESLTKLQDEVKILKAENEKMNLIIEEKENLCSNLENKLATVIQNSKVHEDLQNQLLCAQRKIKELESEKEEFLEARSVTIALSEKVLRIPELEKELSEKKLEITNLRQFLHNNIFLEEMVHDLKTKLIAIQDREKEIPVLKARNAHLESELEKWISVAVDFSNNSTRDSLRDYIESLQRKELTTSLEINNLNAVVRSSEKTLSCLQRELEGMKTRNEKLETSLQKLKAEVQVLRRKSLLVSRERDSYRQQLDLYEKDLTVTGCSSDTVANEMLLQMKTRIQDLEVSLEEYRKHVETLEVQLKDYQFEEHSESNETIYKLKQELKNLEDSNRLLTKIKDELEQKLETRAMRGEYITSDTKILHFRNNPASEAEKKQKEDVQSLREECDKLRARINLLESGDVLNITQKVLDDVKNCNSQKLSELEKELQSTNLKMQRLKEFFKKTSQEFRDVSYMLLGYRIDLASNSKLYKLYNMYSSSPMDYLMFQQTKTGTMEMLGTTFAESLSKLVDEYLHKGHSIPAFLSAVTLELYGSSVQSDDEDESKSNDEIDQENNFPDPIQLD